MENREDCVFVGISDRAFVPDHLPQLLARAVFGPSTVGDLKMARRTFNLIQLGVIPVIICDYCVLPYESMLNWNKFAYFIKESKFNEEGYNFLDELKSIL